MRFGADPRKLVWTFGGDALAVGALGDPVSGAAGYALCAYDGAGASIFSAGVAPGGVCNGGACWTSLGGGAFRYRGGAALADGLTRLVLKPSTGGGARLRVEGAGPHLELPALPVAQLPVVVQLVRADDPAQCWQTSFATARRNTASALRATLP